MKTRLSLPQSRPAAFTLVELSILLALLVLWSMLLIPALARSKPDTRSAHCQKNLRELQRAQHVYALDHAGQLIPNTGGLTTRNTDWVTGWINWGVGIPTGANTNTFYLTNSALAPYFNFDPRLFKCPADVVPSPLGPRVRSYSMNGFVGGTIMSSVYGASTYRSFLKDTDFVAPGPANTVILLDEHPDSINDGLFGTRMPPAALWPAAAQWDDAPGSHHQDAANLSFHDGHVLGHKWSDPETLAPIRKTSPTSATGKTAPNDSLWLTARVSAPL